MDFKISQYIKINDPNRIGSEQMAKQLMEFMKSSATLHLGSKAFKIFDLTRGKYNMPYYMDYNKDMYEVEDDCSNFIDMFQPPRTDFKTLLGEVPVFLVESSMANEYISIPECECLVRVPEDKYSGISGQEFNIDEWVQSKEKEISGIEDDPRERMSCGTTIFDMLGAYVSLHDSVAMPRRIFLWMDKIKACALMRTESKLDREKRANADALFELVLYHEIAHALMDVELYGLHPSPHFSYSKDYVYRFIEEAYANGIALSLVYQGLHTNQQVFIENFVLDQGEGYSCGWVFRNNDAEADTWMAIKILFNMEFALMLREMWKNKHYFLQSYFAFSNVGHKGWLAMLGLDGKRCIIDLTTHRVLNGFKKYDDIWSYGKNGLCMVASGDLYGYINEQGVEQIPVKYEKISSFGHGVSFAKLNGKFGLIDINNQIKIPFSLDYDCIFGIYHNYASMKDGSGKWGVIDLDGHVVLPCQYDFPVSFDEDGVAKVSKDKEMFMIDTRGNRLV